VNFAGVNFAGVNFAGVNFAGVNFAGVNFAGLNFAGRHDIAEVHRASPQSVGFLRGRRASRRATARA
jgi:uncharacterized protein YjbI with pentapeptide repeats